MQSSILKALSTPQKKTEQSKYQIIEERYLKINNYLFGLGDIQNTPRGRSKIVNISNNEISELNSEYKVSQSILNFVLQAKDEEFVNKGVKVLTTRILMQMNSSTSFQSGKKTGEILRDVSKSQLIQAQAINGSVFKYPAVVLPIISEQRWDLYIIMHSKRIFNQKIQSQQQMIIDLIKTIGALRGGKKKNKLKPRLIHVMGSKDSVIQKDVIYESLNQHFKTVMPGEDIIDYLKEPQIGQISQKNLPYQPINIKNQKDQGNSGGYLIFSFLSQVFLKDKTLTPDLKNIDFDSWFSNIDMELDQIKQLLQQIPGTRMVEKDGEKWVEKRNSFFLATPETQDKLLQKLKQDMSPESQQEHKLLEQSMEESKDSINPDSINDGDDDDNEEGSQVENQVSQPAKKLGLALDLSKAIDNAEAEPVKENLQKNQQKNKQNDQQIDEEQDEQKDDDQDKLKDEEEVKSQDGEKVEYNKKEEVKEKHLNQQPATNLQKEVDVFEQQIQQPDQSQKQDEQSDQESDQEHNDAQQGISKINWTVTRPLDKAGSGIYFYDDEDFENEKIEDTNEGQSNIVVQEDQAQQSQINQQTRLINSVNKEQLDSKRVEEQQQQSQGTESQIQLGILIDPKLPENQFQQEQKNQQKLEPQVYDYDKKLQENQKSVDDQEQQMIEVPQVEIPPPPVKALTQIVNEEIQQISQSRQQVTVQSSPAPKEESNGQHRNEEEKNIIINAQFQVSTHNVIEPSSLPQQSQTQESQSKLQINNNDFQAIKNNNDLHLSASIPGVDQQTSKTEEEQSIQNKYQKQDKQIAEQSQQASNLSFPRQAQQEQEQSLAKLQPNNQLQSQIPLAPETSSIQVREQQQKCFDTQQRSSIKSSPTMPKTNKDDGNVSKDLDVTPPSQEIHVEDKNSILNSIPNTPQKVQFKEGQNYKDIQHDIDMNTKGHKHQNSLNEGEEEKKSDHGESILASADQIFTEEDGLNRQNHKKPSDILGYNGKNQDRLVGVRMPNQSVGSGYENRSPITTDDSPEKIEPPQEFKRRFTNKKAKKGQLEIQGRPSRDAGCCGQCKIL